MFQLVACPHLPHPFLSSSLLISIYLLFIHINSQLITSSLSQTLHFTKMCNPKLKSIPPVAQIDGRLVLQPAGNRVAKEEANRPMMKTNQRTLSPTSPTRNVTSVKALPATAKLSSPVSPKLRTCKSMPVKRTIDPNSLSSSTDKPISPKSAAKTRTLLTKKSKKCSTATIQVAAIPNDLLFFRDGAPGSIAAAQREQASLRQAQRKKKIAHYGRIEGKVAPEEATDATVAENKQEEKRCSFITAFSDPLYVAYHDEEWGEPVHDDKLLFELLVLTGAQVGLDWAIILRKRNDFRHAFAGFDADVVAGFTERQIASISSKYGLDLGRVRGFVDNANRILEVRKQFGSLDKYLWGFVNHKPITTNYKFGRKIPVKTSKSEFISKDLVRRGFRFVGPTVIHSFMQAAGLTNDHLISCPRHHHCAALASSTTTHTH